MYLWERVKKEYRLQAVIPNLIGNPVFSTRCHCEESFTCEDDVAISVISLGLR